MADASKKVVLLSGLDEGVLEESLLRFRLTYIGELRPTQRDPVSDQKDPLSKHKHHIRRAFHGQLKRLWETHPFLSSCTMHRKHWGFPERPISERGAQWGHSKDGTEPMREVVADQYKEFGYRFLPLVRDQISLSCSLSVLFLRRDGPGSVLQAGDIDNRIKTLIDALRRPRSAVELVGNETPLNGEDPFYCLMEDDKQVTHLEVETDLLLDPLTDSDADHRRVNLVITVDLRPYNNITMFNLAFS
jgi:hypothetical protein